MGLFAALMTACSQQVSSPIAVHTLTVPVASAETPVPLFPEATGGAAPTRSPVTMPSPTIPASPESFSIGDSLENRPIIAWRIGTGEHIIVLVGGIHGGYEWNSVNLLNELLVYFTENAAEVLPGIQLILIPVANPDGYASGRDFAARFNAAGVDLNRNWGCDWAETAFIWDIPIDPGDGPFSEPETQALQAFFLLVQPDAVIFYHSMQGAVFMGDCGPKHPPAAWMGDLLATATGYPYEEFSIYPVTGDASNWLAQVGIPAATIELSTREQTDFTINLDGVIALQCHFVLGDDYDADPAAWQVCNKVVNDE
nr:hypothetical protein [Anaerolineae bacterium]